MDLLLVPKRLLTPQGFHSRRTPAVSCPRIDPRRPLAKLKSNRHIDFSSTEDWKVPLLPLRGRAERSAFFARQYLKEISSSPDLLSAVHLCLLVESICCFHDFVLQLWRNASVTLTLSIRFWTKFNSCCQIKGHIIHRDFLNLNKNKDFMFLAPVLCHQIVNQLLCFVFFTRN